LLELVGEKRVEEDMLVQHGEEVLGEREGVVGQITPQVREQSLAHHRTHDAQIAGAQERPAEPDELPPQD
jgi:hypothetical protein